MKILIKLYEFKNITHVAQALGVSQQAISEQLKKCRLIFKDQLFIRSGHGVAPTPVADRIVQTLKQVISELDTQLGGVEFDPQKADAEIIISATDYAQEYVLLPLHKFLRQAAPGIKLISGDLKIDNLEEKMSKGLINFAITIPEFAPPKFPSVHLFSDSYACVACADSPIPTQLQLSQLSNYSQIIVSPARNNLVGSSTRWFIENNIQRNITTSLSSFSILPKYLTGTDSVAFLPRKMLPNKCLKVIELPENPPGFDVILVWHPRVSQDPLHAWLINAVTGLTGNLKEPVNPFSTASVPAV